jgi:hypothetical protein
VSEEKDMGEEVTQLDLVNFDSDDSAGCGNNCNVNGGSSLDEVDRATPSDGDEVRLIEKCEKPHAKKLNKPASPAHDVVASEKSKKWFGFMQRNGSAVAANSRSSGGGNSCESGKRNAENMKMDKHRHSWHLNDSAVVEM